MGSTLSVHNKASVPVHIKLGQVGPLHDCVVQPGEIRVQKVGRVWYTVWAAPYYSATQGLRTVDIVVPIAAAAFGAVVFAVGASATVIGLAAGPPTGPGVASTVTMIYNGWSMLCSAFNIGPDVNNVVYTKLCGVYGDGKTVVVAELPIRHNGQPVLSLHTE